MKPDSTSRAPAARVGPDPTAPPTARDRTPAATIIAMIRKPADAVYTQHGQLLAETLPIQLHAPDPQTTPTWNAE